MTGINECKYLRIMMIDTMPRQAANAFKNYAYQKATNNRATENIAGKFIGALTELESARNVELLVALFGDDCEIGSVATSKKFRGSTGVRQFWMLYRNAFKDICSIFQNEIYSGNQAKMQWTTEGISRNNQKFRYEGVSILEIEGGKITHFSAYFDREKVKRQIVEKTGGATARVLKEIEDNGRVTSDEI